MRKYLTYLFFLMMMQAQAQSISYNQYNAVLAEINPAYIANIERDYITLIGRDQWPGYHSSAMMGTFAFSKSFARINSSFGLTAARLQYNNEAYVRNSAALQYGYKVVFLEDYLLSFGVAAHLLDETVRMPVFYDGFSPKREVNAHLLDGAEGKSLYADYGFIVQPFSAAAWYAGFSVRNHFIGNIDEKTDLRHKPTFSLQLMKGIPITRRSSIYGFFSFEQSGSLNRPSDNKMIRKDLQAFFLQANFAHLNDYSLGVGYKYFLNGYGSICYRASYTTQPRKTKNKDDDKPWHPLTIGFSYDIKPYIQNDRIRTFSSYEIFLKFKIFQSHTQFK